MRAEWAPDREDEEGLKVSVTSVSQRDTRAVARAHFVDGMPGHFDRLDLDATSLRALQTERLRSLLAEAIAGSPFHARRLGDVHPASFEMENLSSLPVMTKAEMMASYDDVTTDRRLTRALAEDHLSQAGGETRLLLDEYVVMASGGSSGVRGMFTYRWDELAEFLAGILRTGLRQVASMMGWPFPAPIPIAIVAAPTSVHATRAAPFLMEGAVATPTFAPATLPLREIVERVQAAQPALIAGYTTTIARLADEQVAGRLNVQPRMVVCTSEQLTPELSARIAHGFGAPPTNSFAATEGLTGSAPPGADVFSFASDLAIVEFVDEHDQPVGLGEAAHHVLVTNLFNRTQPLIRYRLDDRMTALEPLATPAHQRARLEGRSDDYVTFDGVAIHPLTIRSTLLRHPAVIEYQVTSAPSSLAVAVVLGGPLDASALEADLTAALVAAGARKGSVSCAVVEALARDPATGKVRRFI